MNWLNTGTYVNDYGQYAARAPGYPAILAGLTSVFGDRVSAVQLFQCLLGALTCLLLVAAASALVPWPWSLLAGFAGIFYYDLVTCTPRVLGECTYIFLIASVFTILLCKKDGPAGWAFLAGLCAAAAALVRPEGLLLVGLAGLYLLAVSMEGKFKKVLLYSLGVVLLYSPWVIRNYQRFDTLVLTTTRAGNATYIGLAISKRRLGQDLKEDPYAPLSPDEIENNRLYKEKAERLYAQTSLRERIHILLFNAATLAYPFHPYYDGTMLLWFLFWAIGALVLLRRRPREAGLLMGFVALSALAYLLFGSTVSRFRQPLSPSLMILVPVGFYALYSAWPKLRFAWVAGGWVAMSLVVWVCGPYLRPAALAVRGLFY